MKYRNKSIHLTIYGRFLILALVVLFLTFGESFRVYASEMDEQLPSGGISNETYTVIGIKDSETLMNLPTLEIVRTSSQDTDPLLYYLVKNKLLSVTAIIADSSGNILPEEDWPSITVSWPCRANNTPVNTTVCGEYVETGTIPLPDGSYTWGDGVPSFITFPVKVYDPEPVEIIRLLEVENDFDTALCLEQNKDIEDILHLQPTWPCYDANDNEYLCPVVYNTENVRNDEVGIYYITVTFEEPLNCRFSDTLDIPTYSIPVSVQAPGQPRLDVSYIGAWNFIYFPWIAYDIYNTMEVWMSENSGEWRMLQSGWDYEIDSSMLTIYTDILPKDSSYRIQVDYEGGQTGIASFTYTDEGLSNAGYIEGDRDGGDTDGNPPTDSEDEENSDITPPSDSEDEENSDITPPSDSEDEENSDITPPSDSEDEENSGNTPPSDSEDEKNSDSIPPDDSKNDENAGNTPPDNYTNNGNGFETNGTVSTPPKKNAVTGQKQSLAVYSSNRTDSSEIKKEDTSTPANDSETKKETEDPIAEREKPYLLGNEITLMMENLDTARFSAETIMLEIPEDAIAALEISDTDRLLVTILPIENNGFSIDISLNDVALTDVSSMQVSLPYQPPANTTPVLMNEADTKVADGDYNPDTGLVSFTINETGIFYIQDEEVPMQDTFSANTLTVTEISAPEQSTDNFVFKLIAIIATVLVTCSVAALIFIYTKKRRR